MDELILELKELTLRVVHKMDDMTYEDLSVFVERRGWIIDHIQAVEVMERSFYKDKIFDILQYDQLILGKLKQLRDEASSALTNINRVRTQKRNYDQIYTLDSVLFDKKN